jgi:hypothetical protein
MKGLKMHIVEYWISGNKLLYINIILFITSCITDMFNYIVAFGLTPSELVELVAIAINISYLLLILFDVLNNRKAKYNAKQYSQKTSG